MILRDHLAVERTRLAGERTVLAYARTALALFAGAATLAHFYGPDAGVATAVLVGAGVAVGGGGVWSVRTSARRTREYVLQSDPPDEAPGDVSPPPATASSGA